MKMSLKWCEQLQVSAMLTKWCLCYSHVMMMSLETCADLCCMMTICLICHVKLQTLMPSLIFPALVSDLFSRTTDLFYAWSLLHLFSLTARQTGVFPSWRLKNGEETATIQQGTERERPARACPWFESHDQTCLGPSGAFLVKQNAACLAVLRSGWRLAWKELRRGVISPSHRMFVRACLWLVPKPIGCLSVATDKTHRMFVSCNWQNQSGLPNNHFLTWRKPFKQLWW